MIPQIVPEHEPAPPVSGACLDHVEVMGAHLHRRQTERQLLVQGITRFRAQRATQPPLAPP